ncbi:MAG: hypothetical protein U1A77_21920 [Pirellulales bacterium]
MRRHVAIALLSSILGLGGSTAWWAEMLLPAGSRPAVVSGEVHAGEIGFSEDFALAADRAIPLKQLIPGTDDYYYYHALHYLSLEQYAKVRELLGPWVERHARNPRVIEIETRLALLTYPQEKDKTLAFLRNRLGLTLNHQREVVGAAPDLPTSLDPQWISRQTLLDRAFRNSSLTDQVEDSLLVWLASQELTPERRRHLLQRQTVPDLPNLAQLVVDDLNYLNSRGFGAMPIHVLMTQQQLEQCVTLKPDLLNETAYVQAYLAKLQPAPDEDWLGDITVREAYLDRLWKFVQKLAPVHNSLKAHVLYHRLASDRTRGVYDRARFLEYLKLPRHLHYVSPVHLKLDANRNVPADVNADFSGSTRMPPIGNDEPLVRDFLERFLVEAADTKEFDPYIQDVYLRHLFASTKILHGLGEPERWASLLPPELYQQLKDRVDIDFAPTNKTRFTVDEPVTLDLFVKNVPTLIVKVYEINTSNYYRTELREVDTDINLDGLVANDETTHKYADPALRRMSRRFEFPQLKKPGVYVIDFIGNGQSSRALVRKGRLRHLVRTTPVGQRFTVLDEQNRLAPDARIWLAGHEYSPDKDGTILVPFSTDPGRRSIVLSRGDLSSLDTFQHESENISLTAGIHVDRESLLARRKARVLIRPGVFVNGTPVSIKTLQDVRLTIVSTDHAGVPTSLEVPQAELFEDRETTHEFVVPSRLAKIDFVLTAKAELKSQGKKIDLAAQESFTVNGIDRTDKIEDLHFLKIDGSYVIDLLGKSGESKAARAIQLTLKHRDFVMPVKATLKTDANGRVSLGALPRIAWVSAAGPEGTEHQWKIDVDAHTYPQSLNARTGEMLEVPYLGAAGEPSREELSLLELRGGTYVADHFAFLSVKNGMVQLNKLPAGDYDLWLKYANARIRVRVVTGEKQGIYVLGSLRQLETRPLAPLQIESLTADADTLVVKLRNSTKFARVHLFAVRYYPAHSAYEQLAKVRDVEPYAFVAGRVDSVYITGRNIGDEYRYILERKQARKFPGSMLERPSLLLNPWAVRSTETGRVDAQGGDKFMKRQEVQAPAADRMRAKSDGESAASGFSNLDFLAESSFVALNLAADEKGEVRVPRKQLGAHQHFHVVAVDPVQATYRSLAVAEPPAGSLDLRLVEGLDPRAHFTQQKQISVVPSGQAFELADVTSSRFEVYDSLARVYGLYTTLTKDPKLAEFSFVIGWPKLKPEEKLARYSKYACHELHFFLARKDPQFFQTVVRPYLANKKDKTFLDLWLLEADLNSQLTPWRHGQLNVAERILLGERVAVERPRTARHVADLFQTLPPNLDEFIRLFDTAARGGELDANNQLQGMVEDAKGEALRALKLAEMKPGDPAPRNIPAPAPASAPEPTTAAGALPPGMPGGMGGGLGAARARWAASAAPAAKSAELTREKESLARDGAASRLDRAVQLKDAASDTPSVLWADEAGEAKARQLYRKLDPTMEWAEENYYHLPIAEQNSGLVAVNAFWLDFAQRNPTQPFLSRNFAAASRNFTEMMLALAVLDLPFESPKHETKIEGRKLTLKTAGPVILFHEEVKPSKEAAGAATILVSQNFFRHGDRHRQENGEQFDKYVTEEFLTHAVYGCQVVVTNPTSSRQKLAVLTQIPLGAIPVLNAQATKTTYVTLEPYHTQTLEYHFYFPAAGEFAHFPVHVARNEELVASTGAFVFHVVAEPTKFDAASWAYVSQNGTNDEVLTFLQKNNVQQLNLDKIAFRLRDKTFFQLVTALLTERRAFHATTWSYSLLHDLPAAIQEYLRHSDPIVAICGGRLSSPLLTIDPVERRTYEHLEYKPLVNARAHALGKRRQIVNNRLHTQYHALLKQLSYQRALTDDDLLTVTYYLLLQDRTEEALETFARVDAAKIATRLQYDYCAAYLALLTEDLPKAREIATRHAKHSVERWRNTFAAVLAQIDEAEGKGNAAVDQDDRTQQQTRLAATEPSLDFTVEAGQMTINYQNLQSVKVNYYVMDVELLFSRNPFVQQFSGQFSAIRPNQTQTVELPAGKTTLKASLPESLRNRNVLVEIVAGGLTKSQAYYANSLAVQVIENYGQVRVAHATTGKPVAKAYVKVYARTATGEVKFYKDGYTDIRGRFEYASLSTPDLETAQRFSILVLSDEHGAAVREAGVPQR